MLSLAIDPVPESSFSIYYLYFDENKVLIENDLSVTNTYTHLAKKCINKNNFSPQNLNLFE